MQNERAVRVLDIEDGIERIGDEDDTDKGLHPCLIPLDEYGVSGECSDNDVGTHFLYVWRYTSVHG